jgi:hypothetical protein
MHRCPLRSEPGSLLATAGQSASGQARASPSLAGHPGRFLFSPSNFLEGPARRWRPCVASPRELSKLPWPLAAPAIFPDGTTPLSWWSFDSSTPSPLSSGAGRIVIERGGQFVVDSRRLWFLSHGYCPKSCGALQMRPVPATVSSSPTANQPAYQPTQPHAT